MCLFLVNPLWLVLGTPLILSEQDNLSVETTAAACRFLCILSSVRCTVLCQGFVKSFLRFCLPLLLCLLLLRLLSPCIVFQTSYCDHIFVQSAVSMAVQVASERFSQQFRDQSSQEFEDFQNMFCSNVRKIQTWFWQKWEEQNKSVRDFCENIDRREELKTDIVVTLSKQASVGLNRHLSKQHDAETVRAIDSVLSRVAFEQRALVPACLTTTTTEDCCGWVNPFLTLVTSYDVMAKVSHLPERRHRTSWFTSVYAWSVGRPAPFLFMHHKKDVTGRPDRLLHAYARSEWRHRTSCFICFYACSEIRHMKSWSTSAYACS